MKQSIIDHFLSTTGYLPPRNEDEMIAFEKVYSSVSIQDGIHIDVGRIINGECLINPTISRVDSIPISTSDIRMAARNYEEMPKEVIEKIKSQHKSKDD